MMLISNYTNFIKSFTLTPLALKIYIKQRSPENKNRKILSSKFISGKINILVLRIYQLQRLDQC
jgi:hypothetical protein